MRRIAALLMLVVAPLAAPLAAQTASTPELAEMPRHPDFSGKWTLDAVQSGAAADGISATVNITQTDKAIKVDQSITSNVGGTVSSTLNYALDGSPSKNTINAQGMSFELTSTTAWDGPVLVVTTNADVGGMAVKTIDHWSLDSTGKVLTLSSDIAAGFQTMSRKQVFKKG